MTAQNHPDASYAGVPVGLPLGGSTVTTSAQVRTSPGQSRGTNTPDSSVPESSPRPRAGVGPDTHRVVGTRRRQALADDLSPRDRLVLERVGEHRYLTTRQVEHFVFTDHASTASAGRVCRRVLARLERDQLLRRLGRRVGGSRAGSDATIWQLAPAGMRLLDASNTGYRTHEPSERFLGHCLAVADTHLAIRDLVTPRTPADDSGSSTVTGVTVQVEPTSWRRYTGTGGEARWLQPDLAAHLAGWDADGDFAEHWFIEVDRGTESLPTLLRKCERYQAYQRSGIEQHEHGVFPLVLWVFDGEVIQAATRRDRLSTSLRRSTRFTPETYRLTTARDLPDTLRSLVSGDAS